MVIAPPPCCPHVHRWPIPSSSPSKVFDSRSTPSLPMPTGLEGEVGVEETGPSPLRIRLPSKLFPRLALSSQQKPGPLLGKRLRVAALPPPLSSPPPISSYQVPSGLPLLPSSSNAL